jgi:transcriptional regulator with XRE-family HTH domain
MDLKSIIKAAGLTQRDLATRIGVSEPALSLMVRGKQAVPAQAVLRIAEALDMNPAVVLRAVVASVTQRTC